MNNHFCLKLLMIASLCTILVGCSTETPTSPYSMRDSQSFGLIAFTALITTFDKGGETVSLKIQVNSPEKGIDSYINNNKLRAADDTALVSEYFDVEKSNPYVDFFITKGESVVIRKRIALPAFDIAWISYSDSTFYGNDGMPHDVEVNYHIDKWHKGLQQISYSGNLWYGKHDGGSGGPWSGVIATTPPLTETWSTTVGANATNVYSAIEMHLSDTTGLNAGQMIVFNTRLQSNVIYRDAKMF